ELLRPRLDCGAVAGHRPAEAGSGGQAVRPPHAWPPQARMLAGTAAIDWARATLSRASEHLTAAQRPDVVNPVLAEVRTISTRLAQLRRAVEQAALED